MDLKIDEILRHIHNVSSNCNLLGKKLIAAGEESFGKALIAHGLIHDNSKFFGIEWDDLNNPDAERRKPAIQQHQRTNPHHPEYWDSIHKMPDIYVAEMVCDWVARAGELGKDVREFIEKEAMINYAFTTGSEVYGKIEKYLDLLLTKFQ